MSNEVKTNIFQRMLAITTELQTVAKNLTVQQTKTSSYKAVGERDILDAVKPLEFKYGVYSYPTRRTILESNLLESESEFQGKVTKKTTFMTRIETVYRFVNVDNPEDYIETTTFAEGIDTQDKGSGKAMTYGDKYALMKAYKISTGDDPDQEASQPENYGKAKPQKKQLSARETFIATCTKYGVDSVAYATDNGINKVTTDEEFLRHCKLIADSAKAKKTKQVDINEL